VIQYTLLGEMPGPNDWKFSRSFPKLPVSYDNINRVPGRQAHSLLDSLDLFNAAFIVTTYPHQESNYQVNLERGINFASKLRPTGILGIFEAIVGNTQMLTIYGSINMPKATGITLPLKPSQYPWDLQEPAPGIALKADLGVDLELGSL